MLLLAVEQNAGSRQRLLQVLIITRERLFRWAIMLMQAAAGQPRSKRSKKSKSNLTTFSVIWKNYLLLLPSELTGMQLAIWYNIFFRKQYNSWKQQHGIVIFSNFLSLVNWISLISYIFNSSSVFALLWQSVDCHVSYTCTDHHRYTMGVIWSWTTWTIWSLLQVVALVTVLPCYFICYWRGNL